MIKNFIVFSLWCIIGCSNEQKVFPVDEVEGDCVGTIRDKAGSPVAGASLMLVPEEYSPLATVDGGTIDTATSDAFGRFGFTTNAPGVYNLLAKTGGLYAMHSKVHLSTRAQVILDNETLSAPGLLSGRVHLQGASDHSNVFVLLMGTNVYAQPADSSGSFTIAKLAEGSYTLRILTVKNDYAPSETTVTVTSGKQTVLPCVELQKQYIPTIDSLSVEYDPVMERVVLKWPQVDTARIKNYTIYCNHSIKNFEPVAIVSKEVTSDTFEIIASPSDTFLYEICAIKNDGANGPTTLANPLIKYSAIGIDTIITPVYFSHFQKFYFDQNENIFTVLENKLIKLDPKGKIIGEYTFEYDTSAIRATTVKQVLLDTAGNIYILIYSRIRSLLKLTNDLQHVTVLQLENSYNYSFAVSATGSIMLISRGYWKSGDTGSYRSIYDSQFNLKEKDSIQQEFTIDNSVINNDTTSCLLKDIDVPNYRVSYFDNAFNEISVYFAIDGRNGFYELSPLVPQKYRPNDNMLYQVSEHLFAAYCFGSSPSPNILLFFDNHFQPVARLPLGKDIYTYGAFSFDCKGNGYCIADRDTSDILQTFAADNNSILKFSIATILK
jgi:hypothetical protein